MIPFFFVFGIVRGLKFQYATKLWLSCWKINPLEKSGNNNYSHCPISMPHSLKNSLDAACKMPKLDLMSSFNIWQVPDESTTQRKLRWFFFNSDLFRTETNTYLTFSKACFFRRQAKMCAVSRSQALLKWRWKHPSSHARLDLCLGLRHREKPSLAWEGATIKLKPLEHIIRVE